MSKNNFPDPIVGTGAQPLNYELLFDREKYQPSIELSRGCGMGCSFCQEKDERRTPLKSPQILTTELVDSLIEDEYGLMTPYFETSMFVPTAHWASALKAALNARNLNFKWRTEARADSGLSKHLEALAECGLSVLDLGLESASPKQLMRMRKTKFPQSHLKQASQLLKIAHANNIKTKVNILLFAGESRDTTNETISWLEQHREYIAGISAGPVMAFGRQEEIQPYFDELKLHGATPTTLQTVPGIHQIHLSKEIDFQESIKISREISQSFMTAEQYYKLKSFSYFPRNYSFRDFLADVAAEPADYGFKS